MIYVSIDIETSGLDYSKHSILSIGAIIEDTSKKLPIESIPKFNAIILQNEILGHPMAISMNNSIIDLISKYDRGDDDIKKIGRAHV